MEHTVISTFLCLPLVSSKYYEQKINLENSKFSVHSMHFYTIELVMDFFKS